MTNNLDPLSEGELDRLEDDPDWLWSAGEEFAAVHKPVFYRLIAQARRAAPAGWRMVPVEPTEAMLDAAYDFEELGADLHDFAAHDCAPGVWAAMLSAVPAVPGDEQC